jgi:hypothetical protein
MNDPLAPLLALTGVGEAVATAGAAVDRLLNHPVLRRRSGDVAGESALRGAWASAWLAGSRRTLDEVRSGAAVDDPLVQGALRIHAATGSFTGIWRHAPRQALARLHVLAGADLVADRMQLGRPVSSASERLDTLAGVLATTSAPAVVVAGVVHGEVLAMDAFPPASGLVARAAARLTLADRGFDPIGLVVVEVGHRELAEQYREALAAYRDGTPGGIARWLCHCAEAITLGARDATAIAEAIRRG